MAYKNRENANGLGKRYHDMGDGVAEGVVAELGLPTIAWQIAATVSSAPQALSATCTRATIAARGADIRYSLTGAANASSSHFLAASDRIDIRFPAGTTINVIRASHATTDGVLEVSELQ